jgi:hypothetical protein
VTVVRNLVRAEWNYAAGVIEEQVESAGYSGAGAAVEDAAARRLLVAPYSHEHPRRPRDSLS